MSLAAAANRWLRKDEWQRRILVVTTVAVALSYAAGVLAIEGGQRSFVKGDARSYFAFLPSLVLDRDVDLRNQFAVLKPEGDTDHPFGLGREGRARTPFPVSPALLWLPGYLVGLGVDRALKPFLVESQPLGYGVGAALGAALWSIFLAGAGLELTRRLAREAVGPDQALPATLLSWGATSALYYTAVSPLYSHAPALFVVSMLLWFTWRAAKQPASTWYWVASGFSGGLIVGVRLQDATLLAVPAFVLVLTLFHETPRARRIAVLGAWAGAALLGYLPEAWVRYQIEGTWVPLGVEALRSIRSSEMIGVLFSTGYRGWISWTPIVMPALVGLFLLARRGGEPAARWLAWSGLIAIVGMFLLDVMHPFGAGAAFGGRRYVSVTPLLALGLATLFSPAVSRHLRATAWVLLPALGVWNLCVLLAYELLTLRHGIYPTLLQAVRYALGGGIS